MSTSVFPSGLDTYQNPTAVSAPNSPSLSYGQTLQNDSLAALEAAVGVTNSTVPGSLTYKVNGLVTYAQSLFTDTGTYLNYAIAPSPAIAAYAAGQRFSFLPSNTNVIGATLNVNGLGNKTIYNNGAVLVSGNIAAGIAATVIYDGTAFQLQNPVYGPWNAWTPVVTNGGTAITVGATTVQAAVYKQTGTTVHMTANVSFTTSGTTTNTVGMNLPVNCAAGFQAIGGGCFVFDGASSGGQYQASSLSGIYVRKIGSNYTLGSTQIIVSATYNIA